MFEIRARVNDISSITSSSRTFQDGNYYFCIRSEKVAVFATMIKVFNEPVTLLVAAKKGARHGETIRRTTGACTGAVYHVSLASFDQRHGQRLGVAGHTSKRTPAHTIAHRRPGARHGTGI